MLDRQSVYAWSILSPTPIYCYDEATASDIVYWQGMVMTRVYALMLIQEWWAQSYATPTMKVCAFKQFKQYYNSGAFGNVKWQSMDNTDPTDHMTKMRKWILKQNANLFTELTQTYSFKEAMLWLAKPEILSDVV